MKSFRQHKGEKGFTLIELLVTILIVALLAALSFTGFQQALEAARASTCNSNQRSLVQAWQAYCVDHDSVSIPYASTPQTSWAYKLIPYLTSRDDGALGNMLACPSARLAPSSTAAPGSYNSSYRVWTGVANGYKNSGYGINYYWYSDPDALGTGASAAVLATKFYRRTVNSQVAEGPVFADAVWVEFRRDSSVPTNFKNPSSTTTCAIVRHKGRGINMAFSDGSVRFVTMGQLFSEVKLNPADTIDPTWINQVPAAYR